MSIYGHYTNQYYGNRIEFPKESFLIAGISNYKENCLDITYDTNLKIEFEPDNKYDPLAIKILNNNKIIGYVPKKDIYIQELCKKYINETLKIINIKKDNNILGIRVIPSRLYSYDKQLEKQIFFSDN